MAREFNMTVNTEKDKLNPTKEEKNNIIVLNRMMRTDLRDVWRQVKGDEKKITFYSSVKVTIR